MKPIILMVNGDVLELKTRNKLVKGNVSGYCLYFSGIDKRQTNVALIESITQEQYVVVDGKGVCRIPECFNLSDEIKISLISVMAGNESRTESVWLYFVE